MGELARRSAPPAKAGKKAAKKTPAKKSTADKLSAKKTAPGKAAPKKAAKKAAAKKAPAKKLPPHKVTGAGPRKKADTARGRSGKSTGPTMGLPSLPAPSDDPLIVLGLTERLNPVELRRAWRVFAARHHPDRGGDAVTFTRGQHAYDVLRRRLNVDEL